MKKAPKTLIVLLAIVFVLNLADALFSGLYYKLAPLAVWSVFAWKALKGSQSAAFLIAGLFALGALFAFYSVVVIEGLDTVTRVIYFIDPLIMAGISAYIFFSPSVRAFYAESAKREYGQH